jgi:SAM-dependent methyltransferase
MPSDRRYGTELLLRRLLPEPVKAAGRLARLALRPPPPPAPPIPQAQLDGAALLTDRMEMLRRLPRGGRVCELGTLRGDFARAILDIVAPDELHLVDVHFGLCRPDVLADPRVRRHEMLTTDFLARPEAGVFDWIYVDADHGYAAVVRDIAAAKGRVRPGGLLVFNDFARIVRPGLGVFGVHQAVSEFLAAEGWPVAYFCLQGEALYDIALRRPGAGE